MTALSHGKLSFRDDENGLENGLELVRVNGHAYVLGGSTAG